VDILGVAMVDLMHYKPKKISSITKKDDKISVVGKVTNSEENFFVLEDSTGKIEIISEKKVEKNKTIRVFCSLIEGKLKADVIQNLEGLDLNLFKRVQDLYYKVGVDV
jgi:hypothetical protein